MATETPDWHHDVLAFWFDELSREQWFDSSGLTDDVIRARFGGLHERLSRRSNHGWDGQHRSQRM